MGCKMVDNIKGISNISGMGGGYEKACQTMLQAGYDWLKKNSKVKLEATSPEFRDKKGNITVEIYGVLTPKSKDAKLLSKAVTNSVSDCTGAQHQAVMGHLMYINANGVEKWKEELEIYYAKKGKKK